MGGLNRMQGKVVLVSGAGSCGPGIGNGRACAVLFAREGARVGVVDIDEAAANDTLRMIREEGGEGVVVTADVAREADCKRAVQAVMDRFGRLDTLINVVGIINPPGKATEVDIPAFEHSMSVNVTSMVSMAKHAVPPMAAGGGGAIVNISSIGGQFACPGLILYSTSKGAILNMTRAMALDHADQGIRVNCICPGMVETPLGMRDPSPETMAKRRDASMLKTSGTGWDVAYAALFLCSDEARWITAQILNVDAGITGYLRN
ncbi:MAG: SDR family NAD(P)-dependent oxidoreductase [Gammaproteobacteria bacterium]